MDQTNVGKPQYIATFHPQVWVNDYAIDADPEGETTWDATAYFDRLDEAQRQARLRHNSDDSDQVRDDTNAPDWVRHWSGPFYISVDVLCQQTCPPTEQLVKNYLRNDKVSVNSLWEVRLEANGQTLGQVFIGEEMVVEHLRTLALHRGEEWNGVDGSLTDRDNLNRIGDRLVYLGENAEGSDIWYQAR